MATLTIGSTGFELPEAEARTAFLAALTIQKRGATRALAVTTNTMLVITPATPICLYLLDGFVNEETPEQVLEKLTKPKRATRLY